MATVTTIPKADSYTEARLIAVVQQLEAALLTIDFTGSIMSLRPPVENYPAIRAAVIGWAIQRNLAVHAADDGFVRSHKVLVGNRPLVTLFASHEVVNWDLFIAVWTVIGMASAEELS